MITLHIEVWDGTQKALSVVFGMIMVKEPTPTPLMTIHLTMDTFTQERIHLGTLAAQ